MGKTADSPDELEADLTEIIIDLLKEASDDDLRKIRDAVHRRTEPAVLMRTAKASVFTDLFSEQEYQSALYEALTGEKRNKDEFRTITLENYLIGEIHNDLGFLAGNTIIVLCEAQSTWNVNIVYRLLCYLVLGWRRLAYEQGWDAFSTPPIPLPEPKLYVLYTGDSDVPDKLTLSETYFGGCHVPIELEVTCVRDGQNGDILQQYKRFTEIVDEVAKKHGRTRQAAAMIIDQCKREGVLVAYMTKRGDAEVLDMLTSVFDEEAAQRIHFETLLDQRTQELTKKLDDQQAIVDDQQATIDDQQKMLDDQKKQAEVDRRNAIVATCLSIGLNREMVLQQLVQQEHLDRAAAETFLRSYPNSWIGQK